MEAALHRGLAIGARGSQRIGVLARQTKLLELFAQHAAIDVVPERAGRGWVHEGDT